MGRPLGAQTRAAVELGASYVRFPEDTVSAIGPSLRFTASSVRGRLAGSASASGVASFSGLDAFADAAGAWLSPLGRGWSGELAGEAGGVCTAAGAVFSFL